MTLSPAITTQAFINLTVSSEFLLKRSASAINDFISTADNLITGPISRLLTSPTDDTHLDKKAKKDNQSFRDLKKTAKKTD